MEGRSQISTSARRTVSKPLHSVYLAGVEPSAGGHCGMEGRIALLVHVPSSWGSVSRRVSLHARAHARTHRHMCTCLRAPHLAWSYGGHPCHPVWPLWSRVHALRACASCVVHVADGSVWLVVVKILHVRASIPHAVYYLFSFPEPSLSTSHTSLASNLFRRFEASTVSDEESTRPRIRLHAAW